MNKKIYDTFIAYLDKEDKDQALLYVLDLLKQGETIQSVYENLLVPSLVYFECPAKDEELCIWYEHTRTSIIRTILEASYPFIIEHREKKINQKMMVVCPQEEFHEIGAIIANHYFSLVGFDSYYIGANTPSEDILLAIKALKPNYVALSVTNYYNLFVTKKLTQAIRSEFPNLKIIVGGRAFENPESLKQIEYDYKLKDYKEILAFKNEVIG